MTTQKGVDFTMKKIVAITVAVMFIFAVLPAAAATFSDLNASHWAYPAVSELVSKGTIGGYTDGSFRPGNTVTRAEFVKMVGVGSKSRDRDYSDVPKSHWAYKYVITSGFLSDSNNNFNPDVAITRGQTIDLLYTRFGKSGAKAPQFVLDQAKELGLKEAAVAWIYAYGVLVGDDGINLRLKDTLTRAEAAALIVKCSKAKAPANASDIFPKDLLKKTADWLGVFEGYSPDKTVTNAELAVIAAKFANCQKNVDFSKYTFGKLIDHEAAKALYVMCDSDIGLKNYTVAFANEKATVKNAQIALKKAAERVQSGNVVYEAITGADGAKAVTHKEIAAILLQYDILVGSQIAITTDKDKKELYLTDNVSMELDSGKLPKNHKDFALILKDVPKAVYEIPIKNSGSEYKAPKEMYDFAREYSSLFVQKCEEYVSAAKKAYGVDMTITFYPSLVYKNNSGFTFRVKITANNSTSVTAGTLFSSAITNVNEKLSKGTSFFAEITVDSII